uniref:Uncharacterized protein n=1 Tax=Oryza punctata TaxID=4537 RepID=A0A0E0K1F0_ORYPU
MEALEVSAHDQSGDDGGHDGGGLELARLVEVGPPAVRRDAVWRGGDTARAVVVGWCRRRIRVQTAKIRTSMAPTTGTVRQGACGAVTWFCDDGAVVSSDGERSRRHRKLAGALSRRGLVGGVSMTYNESLDGMGRRWRCHVGRRLAAGASVLWGFRRRGVGTVAVRVGGSFSALRRMKADRRKGTGAVEFMCWRRLFGGGHWVVAFGREGRLWAKAYLGGPLPGRQWRHLGA